MRFVCHLSEPFGGIRRFDGKKFRIVTSATIAEERLVVVIGVAMFNLEWAKVVVD